MPDIIQVDCREMGWASTVEALDKARRLAKGGEIIELLSTNRRTEQRARAWCDTRESRIQGVEVGRGKVYIFSIRRLRRRAKKTRPRT